MLLCTIILEHEWIVILFRPMCEVRLFFVKFSSHFSPTIEGFKYYKPLIQINETYLVSIKEKFYNLILLTQMGIYFPLLLLLLKKKVCLVGNGLYLHCQNMLPNEMVYA